MPDDTLHLTRVFELCAQVGAVQDLGEFRGGRRRVIPILGGELRGSGLEGQVLPGGADWQTMQPDGVTHLTARYTVKMSDGAILGIVNSGVRRAASEIAKQLSAGVDVDPALYYFVTQPMFEIGPGPYHWLTQQVFVARGTRHPECVVLQVYSVD